MRLEWEFCVPVNCSGAATGMFGTALSLSRMCDLSYFEGSCRASVPLFYYGSVSANAFKVRRLRWAEQRKVPARSERQSQSGAGLFLRSQ